MKPLQVRTHLTLPGNAVTGSLSGARGLVSAAPFTEVAGGAKGLIFFFFLLSAAAAEMLPAHAAEEGGLSLSLPPGDSVGILLDKTGCSRTTPPAPVNVGARVYSARVGVVLC